MNKPLPADFVTDHALVRYLERVLEIDLDGVRQQIADETATAIASGAVSMRKNGLRYIFKGGKVITILLTSNEMERIRRLRTGESHD
ncbi:hypothetical protein SAMN04515647_1652 [Cohaesibacter sp. ES.047]|uniref:hypothetical protein n=1 Tax=Cohaesibacter sp. ES.047 TaxID=1798205 RepID=UPI000BB7A669|nr:hypothetical protein [Cohaesibacter sp. ES.047]SNY91431.1 hypothetical protein SAMN04515647_1652 [Cohaesibacter sp. ES.047]